jgi:hypothetical protein
MQPGAWRQAPVLDVPTHDGVVTVHVLLLLIDAITFTIGWHLRRLLDHARHATNIFFGVALG